MTKTLNQIYLFFLHQNQNIFLEKNITPPPPFKLNGRSLNTTQKIKDWEIPVPLKTGG